MNFMYHASLNQLKNGLKHSLYKINIFHIRTITKHSQQTNTNKVGAIWRKT